MAVNSIGSKNFISRTTNALSQRIVNAMPNMTVSSQSTLNAVKWVGQKISSPQNRLILGASALMTQPFIDLSNKKVDEETRKVSAARTVAKIIAGTLTGVAVRSGCIHGIDAFTKFASEVTPNMKFARLRTLFTPNGVVLHDLNQYKKSLGTIVSLFVMLVTNFLIDAPLTKFLTNKFVDQIHKKDALKNQKSESIDSIQLSSKNKEVVNES
ncbi:hypothetical protein HDR58_03740 [bacterium]|nr:hypothetical protein [bacterium]